LAKQLILRFKIEQVYQTPNSICQIQIAKRYKNRNYPYLESDAETWRACLASESSLGLFLPLLMSRSLDLLLSGSLLRLSGVLLLRLIPFLSLLRLLHGSRLLLPSFLSRKCLLVFVKQRNYTKVAKQRNYIKAAKQRNYTKVA
jgi:hypothetical protein